MIRLELSDREAEILKEVLDQYVSNTRFEAARTDDHDYRAEIHARIDLAVKIAERLARMQAFPSGQVA